jgi:dTMP kinase
MGPRPRLIAFEGIDGAGKSTALDRVAAALRAAGLAVHRPREGKRHRSRPARAIRDLSRDVANLDLCPRAELALYCAREAQVLAESVAPALAREEIVLLDRSLLTPVVLGCWGRGLPLADCEAMTRAAGGDQPAPELTLVFDVDPRTARQRKQIGKIRSHGFREGGRKGLAGSAFKARIRAGYLALAERDPTMQLLVNERDDPEQVTARVLAMLAGAAAQPTQDATPWWRTSLDLDRELDAALDAIPEPLAIYLSRGLRCARARREHATLREPSLVAWSLDRADPLLTELALSDGGDPIHALANLRRVPLAEDDLRLRCAAKSPVAVARALLGVCGRAADELRRSLVAAIPSQHDLERRRAIAGGLLESLAGREDRFASELRELLWPEADNFNRAASLRGCSGDKAEQLRAELFEIDPARALDSLRGVDPQLADERLEHYAATAPKPVLRALFGRADVRAHALRERLHATGSEVVESVAGLMDERSFAIRDTAVDEWPLGVAASLVGVSLDDARAAACFARLRDRARDDLELHCALLRLRESQL